MEVIMNVFWIIKWLCIFRKNKYNNMIKEDLGIKLLRGGGMLGFDC